MKTVKSVINDLRPSVLDLGLFAALEWLVQDFRSRCDTACVLDVDDNEFDRRFDESRSAALFRVAQESLTNICRHAEATQVAVTIRTEGDRLTMTISDNGVGISPQNRRKKNSFGLIGIEERIGELGGTFVVESAPGHGTTLVFQLPLSSRPLFPAMTKSADENAAQP